MEDWAESFGDNLAPACRHYIRSVFPLSLDTDQWWKLIVEYIEDINRCFLGLLLPFLFFV